MVKRSYLIKQLNSIQGEVDNVMLMEGPVDKICSIAVRLFTRTGSKVNAIKNTAGVAPGVVKLAEEMADINKVKKYTAAGTGLATTITAWFWGKSSGKAEARDEANADNLAYAEATGRDPNIDAAVYNGTQTLPKNLPSSKEVISSVPTQHTPSEEQKNAFAKIWDSVVGNYNKVCDTIRDGIKFVGGTPFLVLGYGTALGLMMTGVLAYYIGVGGEMGASLKRVFSDTFNGIKNATGIEQIMRLMMSPILLIMRFIEESPIGTLLFMLGLFVFFIISAGTLIGWSVIFGDGKDKAEGKKPLEANANQQSSQKDDVKQDSAKTGNQQTASGTTDTATGTPSVATGTANAGQPKASYLEPIW